MKDPTKTAAWLVSNCNAGNKRKEIVEKAKNFRLKVNFPFVLLLTFESQVDIYGACGPLKIPSCGRYDNKRDECAAEILTYVSSLIVLQSLGNIIFILPSRTQIV